MLAGGAELGSLLGLDDETAVAALPPDFVVADEEITVGQAAQQFEVTILVLMLGDDVVNKTVPLILCAEENVVGNHGATIGELDDETLFYFESRGISRAQAENILARASIERFARTVDDEVLRAQILQTLEEELNDDV